MQEHPHYKVTPEQGWARLKPALDEAMPIDRRQRRFGLFWWSTSTLLICGVIGLGFVKGTYILLNLPAAVPSEIENAETNSSTSKIENEAVLPPSGSESNQGQNETNNNNAESVSPKINPESILKSNIAPLQNTSNGLPTTSKTSQSEQNIPMALIDEAEEEIPTSANEVQESPLVIDLNNQGLDMNTLPSDNNNATQTASLRNGQVVESLPMVADVDFLTYNISTPSVPTIVTDKSKRNPSFLEPNMAVSGLIGPDGGTGYYGGAGLNVNVSRRFGFTSAIGFISFGPEASLFGGTKSLEAANPNNSVIIQYDPTYAGNETYINPEYLNSSIGYSVISPLVQRINQWQVDLGMKWKWSGRFYTDAGVKLGFQTRAYSEYPIINQAGLGTSTPKVQFDNSLNTYNVIRSNTTSVYAGIGYRFGDHLEVFSTWTHAFDEYLLNEDISSEADLDAGRRTDYIRGLSVGLRYTL